MNRHRGWYLLVMVSLLLGMIPAMAAAEPVEWSKVDLAVQDELAKEGTADFHIIMAVQADVSGAQALKTKVEKTTYVYNELRRTAAETQGPILDYLSSRGLTYEPHYIYNVIAVEAGDLAAVQWLAGRADVARISVAPRPQLDPEWAAMTPAEKVEAVEWNITRIGAPDVWALGYHGEGMVVGDNDTGAQYTHPAVVNQYRGNLGGGNYDHNYNWWDDWGGTPSPYPVDYDSHGTHTLGTMIGDDGGTNQIGVAPGAKWIACAGLSLTCLEFFLTPWDLNHQNPDPSKAPDSVNNSWYDPSGYDYRPIILNMNAAGIAVIKSAGNNGPNCSTISNPGYVPEIIATAAFAQGDTIASFSSRGPMDYYSPGNPYLKPEVAAPGVNVRSSIPTNSYGYKSGTSMAAPHSTALVALIWNAAPCLRGDVPTTKQIMMETAEAKIDGQCPPFVDHPNDVWGWGILDALAAVQLAQSMCGETGTLEGHVNSALEAPIAGATVTAVGPSGSGSATTDGTGYYSITLSAGTYEVTAEHPLYAPQTISGVQVITAQTTVQDFALQPLGRLYGYVTDADSGAPLAATITVAGDGSTTTDPATGYYEIYLEAGTYDVTAEAPDYVSETVSVVITSGGDTQQDFDLLAFVAVVPEPIHATLVLGDLGAVGATFYNHMGAAYSFQFVEIPLERAAGSLAAGGDPEPSGCTPQALCEETYGSTASPWGPGGLRDRGNIFEATEDTVISEIRVWLNFASTTDLYFIVYEGNAVTGSYNKIFENWVDGVGPGAQWYSSGSISVQTEAGKFYYVGASWNGSANYYRGTEPVPITTECFGILHTGIPSTLAGYPPAQTINNTYTGFSPYYFTLVTGGGDVPWLGESIVSGTVPAGGSLGWTNYFTATPAVGIVTPGEYYATLRANPDTAGQPVKDVDVIMTVLPPADMGKLEGTVTGTGYCDQDSYPAADAPVLIEGPGGVTWTVTTNQDGYYYRWLVEGVYTVTASAADHLPATAGVSIVGQQTTTLDFALRLDESCMDVTPLAYSLTLAPDTVYTDTLTIGNAGGGELGWRLAETTATYRLGGAGNAPVAVYDAALAAEVVGEPAVPAAGPAGAVAVFAYPEDVLWDNGPLVTHPGGGAGGADASALQTALGMNTYGFGHQYSLGYRMADDFEVTDPMGWQVESITFFAYQTGSPTNPSPITGVYYQIWDGPPDDPGSSVIFGDLTTNRLVNTTWSNIYRVLDTGLLDTQRPIMADTCSAGVTLPPGTYWLDWMTNGSLSSGPWAPPISIVGQTTTGNALQYTGAWAAALDSGTSTPQGMPFIIEGTGGYADVPWVSEVPTVGVVLPDSSFDVDVIFDSTGLGINQCYTASLLLIHDDPGWATPFPIPLTLCVVGCVQVSDADFSWTPITPTVGEEVTFDGTAVGDEPITYTWSFGDGAVGSGQSVTHSYDAEGVYSVVMTATNCSGQGVVTATYEITVEPVPCEPVEILGIGGGVDGCVVDFYATVTGTEPIEYLWDLGDFGTYTTPGGTVDFGASGTYPYTLTVSNCGGQYTDIVTGTWTVTCCQEVEILVITPTIDGCSVSFAVALSGEAPFTYLWSFGDGMTSTEAMPVHDYGATGVYSGTLEVWNCQEGYDSAPFRVEVECTVFYYIYLPLIVRGTP